MTEIDQMGTALAATLVATGDTPERALERARALAETVDRLLPVVYRNRDRAIARQAVLNVFETARELDNGDEPLFFRAGWIKEQVPE